MNQPRNFALALQILLAASAFGAAAPKPPAADTVRNVHGPRSDFLAVGWALNEASGTTATNIGKRASYNGTLASDAWTSNGDGVYANAIVRGPVAASDLYYPRGTMLIYANAGAGATTLRIVASTESGAFPPEETYEFQVGIAASVDTVRMLYVNAAGAPQTINAVATYDITDTSWVPIVIRWGESGLRLDTLGAPQATNAATTGLLFRKTYNLILNAHSEGTSAGQRVHAFAWWDWQLNDRQVRELMADPFLPWRPRLVESGLYQVMHTANPIVGRPTSTTLTWQVGAPPLGDYGTYTKELDWRIAYTRADASIAADITSTGVLDLSAATTTGWAEVRSTGAGLPSTITATGLTAGTLYVWQAQYREDDGTVQAFPGGIGYATTQRTSGAYNFAVTTDCHEGVIYDSGVLELARGLDVTSNGAHDQQMRRGFISASDMLDWCFANGCDFTVDVGDSFMGKSADAWASVMNDVFKCGALYQVLGNHEKMAGAYLEVEAGEDNRLADAIVTARRMVANPTGSTYAQGGESEGCPATPYAGMGGDAYCSHVSWIPSNASCSDAMFPVVADASGTDWVNEAAARTSFESFVLFNTAGVTWEDKLGPLYDACSNGLGNYYGWTWGAASFWALDPYTYTATGSDEHDLARASIDDWQYGFVQQSWAEAALAADTSSWKFIFQHQLPGGLIGGPNGATADYYGRGSGASAPATAAEKWYWGILRQYGATGFKGHDHGFAVVEQGGAQVITVGNFASSSRFIGDSWRWTYPLDYGDPSMFGANVPQVETMRPQWGWGHVSVAADGSATYTYRQTIVDQRDIDAQSTPDTWDADHRMSGEVGEVLIVDANGDVTLSETPNDVLVLCDADDGDFLQYGWDAVIADTNWGSANDYSPTLQDWGTNGSGYATIDLAAFTEPHADAVIATGKAAGTRVRVHYAPRDLYTVTLHRAVSNPTYVPLKGTVRGSAGLHYRGD